MSEDLLSYHEVEELLETILTNKTFKQLDAKLGPKFVLLRHPSTQEVIYSRYIRQKALVEAQAEGLPTKEDLDRVIKERQITTPADEAAIKDIQEKIAGQKRLLQITKIKGRRQPIEDNISRLEDEIQKIELKSQSMYHMSAEAKADEEAILYLSFASAYTMEGERYWDNFQDFENEQDLYLRNSLIDHFLVFNRGISVKTIRFLARHGLWRIRYSAALKVGGRLFDNELSQLTTDQLSLLYWSDYYQMIYEMLPDDRPDDDIIADDEALDEHVAMIAKQRQEERNEAKVKRRGGNSKKGKLSAWDRGEELIITAAHPEYTNMNYSEERIKASGETSEVEVIAPNSRRAQNRRAARRNKR